MIFHSIANIFPRILYVIPTNSHTTWHYLSNLKCKKMSLHLPSLTIEQDCWLWSYWSSQWGGNGSVENGLNAKCYYINTILQTEGKRSPYLKATPTQKVLVAWYTASTAIWEVLTGRCHMVLLIGNINLSTSMQPQKFSCKCPFCTLTTKAFPLESFAIYDNMSNSFFNLLFYYNV